MKIRKYFKLLCVVSLAAFLCCAAWLYWTIGRSYALSINPPATTIDYESLRNILVNGHVVTSVVLGIILGLFLYAQLLTIRRGKVFCKRCYRCLLIWAAVWPFYDISASCVNSMLRNEAFNEIVVRGSAFGITFLALVLGIAYKMCYETGREKGWSL